MLEIPPENTNDLLSYPRSRASVTSEGQIVRSRTWSEDITKTWNLPIAGLETIEERAERYTVYFTMTTVQLRLMHDKFVSEMKIGLELHRSDPRSPWDKTKCSLKMCDTFVTESMLPKGDEKGTTYAIDFGGIDAGVIRAIKLDLEGKGHTQLKSVSLKLRDAVPELPKGLLDRRATASQLFDGTANLIKKLKDSTNNQQENLPVAFSFCFPVDQRSLKSARLVHWSKGFETGRTTIDHVENMDVGALLDCAFKRNEVSAKTAAIINDTTGTLLACAYERGCSMPSCRVGFVLASGFNGCYVQPDAAHTYHYKGAIVNCEFGSFDKSLPVNNVDLEVDFADEATESLQMFEKMVATTYLGELCRRLVVKVWQSEAPQLAWVRYSMPWLACVRVIADKSSDLSVVREVLLGLWEWDLSEAYRRLVQQLFEVVFDRSAALAAVALVALAGRTGRLQPAMGGVTCGIGGSLYSKCEMYKKALKKYLSVVSDEETARLITIADVTDGVAKGGGLLAHMIAKTQ